MLINKYIDLIEIFDCQISLYQLEKVIVTMQRIHYRYKSAQEVF